MLLEWVHFLENSFLEGVTALYNAIGWSGVGLLMAIENTFIPLPSEVIMPFAGWKLVLERGLGISWILWAGFVGAVGSLVGAILEYYVARYAGRGFIIRYGKWFLLSESEIIKTEKWFEKWGTWAVVIVRFIPGLRGVVAIPAGIAKMNIFKFSVLTFVTALPWTTLLAWLGYLFGENYTVLSDILRPFYIPIAAVTLALIAFFIYKRIRQIRSEQRAKLS